MTTSLKNIAKQIEERINPIYEVDEARAIARLVVEEITGTGPTDLVMDRMIRLEPEQSRHLEEIINRLADHEPVQHILGYAWFMGKKYKVGREVLVPRQETEELVDLIARQNDKPGLKVLDIGTGTGCIAISLEFLLPGAEVHAVDVHEAVLKLAKVNADTHRSDITFHQADILHDFPPISEIDIIVSNPPYVGDNEKAEVPRNVRDFEPTEALFVPGDDPLIFYRKITSWAYEKLKRGGRLYFEIHEEKGNEIKRLMVEYDFTEVEIMKDLNGKDRMAVGVRL